MKLINLPDYYAPVLLTQALGTTGTAWTQSSLEREQSQRLECPCNQNAVVSKQCIT